MIATTNPTLPAAAPEECPVCRRGFADQNALWQHAKAKHGRKVAEPLRPIIDREPSMGDLVAEAMMARAVGDPVDPWIAEMFDV